MTETKEMPVMRDWQSGYSWIETPEFEGISIETPKSQKRREKGWKKPKCRISKDLGATKEEIAKRKDRKKQVVQAMMTENYFILMSEAKF